MILGKNWRKGLGIKKIKAYMILFNFHYGRQWHPTPVLLPGESHGWRSLVGCSPWGRNWATSLSLFTFHALEKEMATYSSVLAWRIPGTGRPAVYGVARSRTRLKQLSSMAISFPPNVLPSITSAHQTSFHLKACGHVFFPLRFALLTPLSSFRSQSK